MPKYQPVNILGGCYSDSDRAWSLQDTVNWLPEQAEQSETRTPTQFKTPPGLRPFLEIPSTGGGEDPVIPSKPVRGTYNCENKLFAAIGKTLYQITNSGVAIPQGTIPGNTRVTMTHNQISQGNQLVAVNGSSGYVFNTLTQVYEKIVDEGFPGAIWVGFADGYILGVEPGRRFAFNSEPADALNYNTLDRFTSEYKPDLIVTGIVNNNELILLNETSYEFFENTGATQQPFRSKRIYGDVGCASRFGACNLDRTVFMFGADGKFYRLEGYSWQRISTRPIEQAIRGLNWSQAFCYTWDDAGHSIVYWTFPDGFTWGFDQSTQLWHRRKSLGLDRWRPNTSTQLGQNWYMGDFQTGRIWVMDWDYILEGDDEIESERVTGVLSDNQNLAIVNRLELLFATGQQLTVPVPFPDQPDSPDITGDAPNGTVGEDYGPYSYSVAGGTPPYIVSRRPGGTYPPGLDAINIAGTITLSEPTQTGTYTFTVRATDSEGLFDELTDTIEIGTGPMLVMGQTLDDSSQRRFISSTNGSEWSPLIVPVNASTASRLFAAKDFRFVASLGGTTNARFSDDLGGTWTLTTLANQASTQGNAVVTAAAVVMTGVGGMNRSVDNAVTWVSVGPAVTTDNITGYDELIVALTTETRPTISTDQGVTFSTPGDRLDTVLNPPLSFQFAAETDGELIVFAGSETSGFPVVAYSEDGESFFSEQIDNVARNITALRYGVLANGDKLWIAGCSDGALYRAEDTPTDWVLCNDSLSVPVEDIMFNGVVFVAGGGDLGDTEIKYSTNGDDWEVSTQLLSYKIFSMAQGRS